MFQTLMPLYFIDLFTEIKQASFVLPYILSLSCDRAVEAQYLLRNSPDI